eukprot:XP_001689426.1 predicted protein [Chlamydomonas reinhardtii]
MFGGQQGRKFLRTLFCFDTDTCTWTRLPEADSQPAARAGHSMVTVHGSVVYLFGGQGKRLYNDLFKLDPSTGSFSEVEASGKPPAPRRGHSLTWDGRDYLVCFGGINQSSTDSALTVFSLSRGAWFTPQAFGPAPSARTQHTAQLLSPGIILIFGGCNSGGTFFNDAVVLDTRTFTWHKPALLNTAPAPRYHHTCNLVNGRIVVYGGINSKQTFDGVVVVETKFAADLANVAEELFRMSADAGGAASVAASVLQTTSANMAAAGPTAAVAAAAASAAASAAAASSSVTQLGALQLGPAHTPSRLMLSTTPHGSTLTAVSVSRAAMPTASSTVASTPTAAGQPHNTTPTLSSSAHPMLQVVPAPPAATSELVNISSSKSLEAVKVQLTDLLLRRNQEEQLLQTAKKAETTESLLHKEREAREAATKEVLQYKLLLAEAEEAQASTQQQLQSILARATREAATVTELRGQVEQLQSKLASREEELQEARLLQDGLVKELGIMASRYSRLAMDVQDNSDRPDRNGGGGAAAAVERGTPAGGAAHAVSSSTRCTSLSRMLAQAHAGGSGAPAAAGPRMVCPGMSTGQSVSPTAEELQASGSYSVPLPEPSRNSMLGARGPFPTPALSTQCTGPQHARSGANAIASASTAQPQAGGVAGGSALPVTPCGNCCQQLLGLLSDAEMHRAALLESNQSLSDKVDELTNQNSMLYVQLRQMLAEASALEPLALGEMEELERKLEASSRSVRDALIQRKIDEAQRRSNSEQAACAVCMEGPKAVVFNCGHQSCEACSGKMSSCPFCRVAITARIRLFDA